MILSLLLLSVPTIYEIVSDVKEWRKDERDKKTRDVIIRGLMMVLVALIDCLFVGKESFWQGYILSIGLFVMFFDYIMGIYLTKNPFFLGTTSQTDSIWKFLPWYLGVLVRGTFFAATIILYQYWDIIRFLFKHY
jgi:hypothetical protein